MIRPVLSSTLAFLAAIATVGSQAQELPPGKVIRIVTINAPGGAADFASRLVAERLQQQLSRTVIVENRPGAAGNLATQYVVAQPADGTTLLLTSNNHTLNSLMYKPRPYDPETDLVPVIMVASGPSAIIVNATLPAKNLQEFLAYARSKPGGISFGTGGVGNPNHIAAELLKMESGAPLVHVPYKGSAPAITDLLGGQIDAVFTTLPSVIPHLTSRRLRAIAVSGSSRWAGTPEVPTVAESGVPGYKYDVWMAMFAPKGTPPATVKLLHDNIATMLASAEVREKMSAQGFEPGALSIAELAAFVRDDLGLAARIVRESKMQAE